MNNKIKDKLWLIATGLLIFSLGLPAYFYLKNRLSEEWALFIVASLGYLIALIYLPFTLGGLRKLSKLRIIMFQFSVWLVTIALAALLFKLQILPIPSKAAPYWIAIVCLGSATMIFFEYCTRKWNFLKQKRP
jgi:hypothetical protein